MITPLFKIDQDDEYVFMEVKVSHVRFSSSSLEMVVEQELFIFSLQPYYLRIRLPCPIVDDERSGAVYESKEEVVKIRVAKANRGEVFPDLDLTTKLLARNGSNGSNGAGFGDEMVIAGEKGNNGGGTLAGNKGALIEELDVSNKMENGQGQVEKDAAEGEAFNWEISQTLPLAETNDGEELKKTPGQNYGFNCAYREIIGVSLANGNDINELGDPENTPCNDRIIERLIKENIKFDAEYYAADYIMEKHPSEDDDKRIGQLIEWVSPWTKKFLRWYKAQQNLEEEKREQVLPVSFSDTEQEKMLQLPRKTYLIDDFYKPQLLVLLVSLLFSFHFDLRETEGDHSVESAWTVGKLTPQIAFLDSNIVVPGLTSNESILRAGIVTSTRRALSYPLHRNHQLVQRVWEDVYYNLRGGKRFVLQALLELKELFRFHDVYYVYDKIWFQDLCSWLISDDVSENMIRRLAHDLKKENDRLSKTDITFEKVENPDDDEEEMVAVNLHEIEIMAEELFRSYTNQ